MVAPLKKIANQSIPSNRIFSNIPLLETNRRNFHSILEPSKITDKAATQDHENKILVHNFHHKDIPPQKKHKTTIIIQKPSSQNVKYRPVNTNKAPKPISTDNITEEVREMRDTHATKLRSLHTELKKKKQCLYYDKAENTIKVSNDLQQDPIVDFNKIQETKFGKKPTVSELIVKTPFGKPNENQSFTTNADLWNVILPIAKSGFLVQNSVANLGQAHSLFGHLYDTMRKLVNVDFTDLNEIDTSWNERTHIPTNFIQKYTACAIFYNFHLGSVMRYCGNNYINSHIDLEHIKKECTGVVPDFILKDLIRLFTDGTPAYIRGESTRKNFYEYWRYGNHSTINKDMKKIQKLMLKEFKNQWMFALPCWLARFIPNGHMTPEGIASKENKKDRPFFDASFLVSALSICINMCTHKDNEPEIHYGETLMNILIRIWNLRITYPELDLYLMCDDVAGAFRHGKYNPEILSAFMYRIQRLLIVSCGQNFGTNFAANNFEAIARAREHLAEHYFDKEGLCTKHKDLLDQMKFKHEPLDVNEIIPAVIDSSHKGVLDAQGQPQKTPHNMFVDDNTICDVLPRIKPAMAAGFEALFTLLGHPDLSQRNSVIAMDKLSECTCSFENVTLGFKINTRKMTIMRNPPKLLLLAKDLKTKWSTSRKNVTLKDLSSLQGRIQDIANYSIWAKTLFLDLRNSVQYAQNKNQKFIFSNPFYGPLINKSKYVGDDKARIMEAKFAQQKLQKALWSHPHRFELSKNLRKNIKLMQHYLQKLDCWETPISHIIPREPEFHTKGDACLDSGGGWSTDLLFWWYLEWPDDLKNKTLKYREPGTDTLLTINVMEYLVAIVDYACASFQWRRYLRGEIIFKKVINNPYPVVLNWADNKSAVRWLTTLAYKTKYGKALSKIHGALNFGNPLGLHSDFTSGVSNYIADTISRFDSHLVSSQFQQFLQEKPELADCQRLYPTKQFTSTLFSALRNPESFNIELEKLNIDQLLSLVDVSS